MTESVDLHPPRAVLELARTLEAAGYDTWAVGGAVRDVLLGRPAGDWDLATAARPEQVRRTFRRTVPVGIEHGTVGVLASDGVLYEVTTFRRDIETFGRHAVVAFADTIDEDLSRRDFTFNAIAWHPERRTLRDPFGGLADLEAHRLRTVGSAEERFAEDYLRVLRALRFAGQLGLAIEPDSWRALVAARGKLTELSPERVREELWKIFRNVPRASGCLSLYAAAGVLEVLYPELAALVGLEQEPGHTHDAWTESLLAVDALPTTRPRLRMAALLHAAGKPGTRMRDLRGGWRTTGHQVQGAAIAEALLTRLRASNADIASVRDLVGLQAELFPPDAPPAGVRRWLHQVGRVRVRDLFRLRAALYRANPALGAVGERDLLERWGKVRTELRTGPPLSIGELALGGAELKALGLKPGPHFGEILAALLDRVIEDPTLNDPDRLREIVRRELMS